MTTPARLTNAALTRQLAFISRNAAAAVAGMTEGMWNPDFCSATDHTAYAMSFCADLRKIIERIEKIAQETDAGLAALANEPCP